MNKKKIKKEKFYSDDQVEIMRFVKIIIIIAIFIGAFYLIAKFFTKDKKAEETTEQTQITVNYDKAIIGNMFNRPYEEYYVVIYDTTSKDATMISALTSKYTQKEDSLKFYQVDLNNPLNKTYYDKDNSNITTDFSKLKVGDLTLLKIVKGQITKYVTTLDEIKTQLAI